MSDHDKDALRQWAVHQKSYLLNRLDFSEYYKVEKWFNRMMEAIDK
jgi:hypothetical protein